MELWIRSQDRITLCKCNNIYIDDEWVSPYYIKNGTLTLGKYSTKERALEVLDEIQKILRLKDMYKYDKEIVLKGWGIINSNQIQTIRQQMSVYEMPKE